MVLGDGVDGVEGGASVGHPVPLLLVYRRTSLYELTQIHRFTESRQSWLK